MIKATKEIINEFDSYFEKRKNDILESIDNIKPLSEMTLEEILAEAENY